MRLPQRTVELVGDVLDRSVAVWPGGGEEGSGENLGVGYYPQGVGNHFEDIAWSG